MLIKLELDTNNADSLLRHCAGYHPMSGDSLEDSRLSEALDTLAVAIREAVNAEHLIEGSKGRINPRLLEAAISVFGNEALAINWLSKPMRGLVGKRPLDIDIEEALALICRLEHGFGA